MDDFWVASGHLFCDCDPAGRLLPTPDLWRAFLARPELVPPEEACDAELALHTSLLADPLRAVPPAQVAALADADARENWQVFLGFRDRVQAQPSLEAAWLALFRGDVRGIPPLFLQMLTHLVSRAALDGEADPYALRAAELFFRPQRAAIHQGATLLADEEVLDARAADGDLGSLGRLLTEAGAAPRAVELEVLSEANAASYRARSDAHDLALDIAEDRPGQHGLARALERFVLHVMGERVAIRPVPVIEDRNWTWHVGLDPEATAIANDLWQGRAVKQVRLARILWLGVLEFAEMSRVLPRAAGRPVYLALAMDAAQRVRLKPQNLVGLPLALPGGGRMSGRLEVPGSLRIPVAVLVERRPGVTPWAEWSWRAVEVLEDAPEAPPWTVLREAEGRTLFLAGHAEVALHPTDTTNYRDNLTSAAPSAWVVLRQAEAAPGFALHLVTVDAGEAHVYADAGNDLLEALPMPPGLRAVTEAFVAEHHVERSVHKRRRDRADPEALARGGRPEPEEQAG